jgi:hypothetical protein
MVTNINKTNNPVPSQTKQGSWCKDATKGKFNSITIDISNPIV